MRTKTLGLSILMLAIAGAAAFAVAGRRAGESAAASTAGESAPSPAADAAPDTSATPRVTPLPTDGVVIERAPFVLTVAATGRAMAQQRARLSARVGERVGAVAVTEGARVHAGDRLVELDARPFEITLHEAQARFASAEADFRIRVASDTTLTEERRELVAHRTGLTEAREALARARLDLESTHLVAPFDGIVAAVEAQPGERVVANAPLIDLVALDPIRIPAEVLETDFGRLAPGAAARVRFAAFPGETFPGEVAALGPEIDPERGTGLAWVTLPNPDGRIRPGMWADVEIAGSVLADRLSVPRAAVLERDRRLLVFRVEDGRAEWQYVETGLESSGRIEITKGLAPGDTVLVGGHLTLAHGAPVAVSLVE